LLAEVARIAPGAGRCMSARAQARASNDQPELQGRRALADGEVGGGRDVWTLEAITTPGTTAPTPMAYAFK